MKLIKFTLFVAASLILLVSCGGSKNVTKAQLSDKWVLKSINNRPAMEVFPEKIPYAIFNFNIDQISGHAGCNSFSGKFTYGGGKFKAPNLAMTMMACEASNMENEFVKLLGNESKLSILNGDLIFSQNNMPVLVFSRAKPLSTSDLSGVWRLHSVEGSTVEGDFAKTPPIEFMSGSNRVSGNAGCNTYNTTYTLSKNILDVNTLVTTRMTCPDIKHETKFINLLPGRSEVEVDNGMLILRRDNRMVLIFRR